MLEYLLCGTAFSIISLLVYDRWVKWKRSKVRWPEEPQPYGMVVGTDLVVLMPSPDPRLASFYILTGRYRGGYFNSTNYTDADRFNVQHALTQGDIEGATKLLKDLCFDCAVVPIGWMGD